MVEVSQLGCAELGLGPVRRAQLDLADLRSEDSGSEPMRFEQLSLEPVTVAQLSCGRGMGRVVGDAELDVANGRLFR